MDLETAVAVSMLPVSRGPASAAFRELRQQRDGPSLNSVLDALRVPAGAHPQMIADARSAASRAIEAGRASNIQVVPWFDESYPALLGCIPDPPPVLWVRGDPAVLTRPAVAVIGSRAATSYALAVGGRLAAELASRSMVVVSGLARGVDSAAHRGCLDALGATVAVLGSGLDNVYPPEHEGPAPRRFPSTFRCATGSSAGSRWPWSSSKPPRRAGPSSPPGARSNRGATSWRFRAASSPAGTAAPTAF